jgi:hypothetical protein
MRERAPTAHGARLRAIQSGPGALSIACAARGAVGRGVVCLSVCIGQWRHASRLQVPSCAFVRSARRGSARRYALSDSELVMRAMQCGIARVRQARLICAAVTD